jgi:lipid A oxidase
MARFTNVIRLSIAAVLFVPASAGADWLAAAFLGQASTQPGTITLALPDRQTRLEIADAEYRGESFESPPYYGLRFGWIPKDRWVGLEGEFIHAKVFTNTARTAQIRGTRNGVPIDTRLPLSSVVERLAMSHGLNFALVNVVLRRELGRATSGAARRVAIAARAGAGPTFPHAESTIEGVAREQYESGGMGAQVGGGVDVALWHGIGALGEYKFTWAAPEIDVAGGEAKIHARTHHVVFGLTYRF